MSMSFRDPGGRLFVHQGQILRAVSADGLDCLTSYQRSSAAQRFTQERRIVATEVLSEDEVNQVRASGGIEFLKDYDVKLLLRHEAIPFPSFPYEWAPEMLHAAGMHTLDLARELLGEGYGLKDATPYNVVFRGPDPVFVDILSIERRDPCDPTWLPYAQFVRTFLIPLLLNKHFGLPLSQLLTTRRDGIEPEEAYRLSRPIRRMLPPFLGLVTLPALLRLSSRSRSPELYARRSTSRERAQFVLSSLFAQLRRTLKRLEPSATRTSAWSGYFEGANSYEAQQFADKEAFVRRIVERIRPRSVLDIGCNTGRFSELAVRAGASVVAIDYDATVVGRLWRSARERKLQILPLTVDITRPSPALGWGNLELPSFLDRARRKFDLVLMLAVLHHVLITERVPLRAVLELASEMTTQFLVIEFVHPSDEMFRQLTRGRDQLFADLTREAFESEMSRELVILERLPIASSSRTLYLARKKDG